MSIKYLVELNDYQECLIQKMISDNRLWPGHCPPVDVGQLINWAIADYIDYYKSYSNNKEGEQ
ncbi:hypothetical protein [Limosilactobacillus vaginalis]|uniref:hypothetical protein n=1 Tax=Limosilactobacillus vaginalis TaxID=1633 RepID=UPI001D4AAD13|nr:hypothetical protein [Limosilactobacillus vaginalis]MDM8264396.1 hypothetical protein [Limosilactobacillus vaginalis]HJG16723.1 hypothetical protein [Limosilactobacillus vaginalis]